MGYDAADYEDFLAFKTGAARARIAQQAVNDLGAGPPGPPKMAADRDALAALIGFVAADLVIEAGWRPPGSGPDPR